MAFDDVRLPIDIEQGASGGPNFFTTITTFSSGQEQRNQSWANARGTWDISYGVQDKSDYAIVREFFYARRGRLRGFRFKDWLDFSTQGEPIATAPGSVSQFQLLVNYISGDQNYVRKITRPVAGTLVAYVNGTSEPFTLNSAGLFTFNSAPASGAAITADFEWDVPVRFDVDAFSVTSTFYTSGAIPAISIKEIIE